MPDKIWRKKIHVKQPKDVPPLPPKTGGDDSAAFNERIDRRRPHHWRKTVQTTHSETSLNVNELPATPVTEGAEDTQSERSEPSLSRPSTKPKLARYTSLFSSFKELTKGPDFDEPWSEETQPIFESYTDPLNALHAIRSQMTVTSTRPIPFEHHNGLFRIFEDYQKVREEKEALETFSRGLLRDWSKAEGQWIDSELCYKAEIRRLDLLIAKGTGGMAGLFQARQGSIVDRKRHHRRTISTDKLMPRYIDLSSKQLEDQIKSGDDQGFLHQPVLSSAKLENLPRQFADEKIALYRGDSSDAHKGIGVSRRVHSELNLNSMRMSKPQTITNSSAASAVHGTANSSGSGLLLSRTVHEPVLLAPMANDEAFIALRELGVRVARGRGLSAEHFTNGLVLLFSRTNLEATHIQHNHDRIDPICYRPEDETPCVSTFGNMEVLPSAHTLRRPRSQPHLSFDHKRRRHFSFEPGEDELRALDKGIGALDASDRSEQDCDSPDHARPLLSRSQDYVLNQRSTNSSLAFHTLGGDLHRPSKIPSPVQTLGRVRRENSASSLRSIFVSSASKRRNSGSSIVTVFWETPSSSLRTVSKIKSTLNHDIRTSQSIVSPREQ